MGPWPLIMRKVLFFFLCNNRRGHRGACDSVSVDEEWPLGCGWACGFADCFGHKMHHGDGRFGGFMYKYNTLYKDYTSLFSSSIWPTSWIQTAFSSIKREDFLRASLLPWMEPSARTVMF